MGKQPATKDPTQGETPVRDARLRVGVIAGDSLRLLGFQVLFEGHIVVQIVPLASVSVLPEQCVDVVIIAAESTDKMFATIRGIRAAGGGVPMVVMAAAADAEQRSRSGLTPTRGPTQESEVQDRDGPGHSELGR